MRPSTLLNALSHSPSLLPPLPLRRRLASCLLLCSILLLLQLPAQQASSLTCSQPDWLPVGNTGDCLWLNEDAAVNVTAARQRCLSLGNGSRLVILRNYQFSLQLLAALNMSTDNSSRTYWIGAYYDNHQSLKWVDAPDYIDASMSPLPGNVVASERFIGKNGSLVFDPNAADTAAALQLQFSAGSDTALPLCARQLLESPYQPAVSYSAALRCPGPSARLHRGVCYRLLNAPSVVASSRWNHSEALTACRNWSSAAGSTASLAVVNDFNTEFLVTALVSAEAKGHTWLGLTYHKLQLGATASGYWSWPGASDATMMRHTNWKLSEPSRPYTDEACVVAHQREVNVGEWNNVPCKAKFPTALCQAAASIGTSSSARGFPAEPIGLAAAANGSRCRVGFYEYGQACWLLEASPSSSGSRSALAAECASRNASLAFFHQRGEQAFLSALAEQLGGLNFSVWLGLKLRKENDAWLLTWDDGSQADYDFVWQALPSQLKMANATNRLCAALRLDSNAMVAIPCNATMPRLSCRYNLAEHPLAPNKSQELRCPADTPAVNGKCFQLVAVKARSWEDARIECLKLGNGSSLASIHSRREQLAVSSLLKDPSTAWLGMAILDGEGLQRPAWLDDSPVDFFQFRHSHPDAQTGGVQLCVFMDSKYGEWLTGPCYLSRSYVCQSPGLPLLSSSTTSTVATTTPTPAVNSSSSSSPATSTVPSTSSAPGKVTSRASTAAPSATPTAASHSCSTLAPGVTATTPSLDGTGCVDYLYSADAQSWQAANDWCQKKLPDGALAAVMSSNESEWVLGLLQHELSKAATPPTLAAVWIGAGTSLSRVANAFSAWSDGQPMRYANFAPIDDGDRATGLTGNICAAVSLTNAPSQGAWLEQPCGTALPFLCKRTRRFLDAAATPQPPATTGGAACPAGWAAAPDGDACYRLLEEAGPRHTAADACVSAGGLLASYQTPRQLQRMASLLVDGRPAWIGLHFNRTLPGGGAYQWLDSRPVDYVDWATRAASWSLECVQLTGNRYWWLSGHMRAASCADSLRPLCRLQAAPKAAAAAAAVVVVDNGCPAEFARFNDSCYLLPSTGAAAKATYAAADTACRTRGARLLELDSTVELHFLRSALPAAAAADAYDDDKAAVWLGLSATGDCGAVGSCNWTWASTGQPLRFDLIYPAVALGRLPLASLKAGGCYAMNVNQGLLAATVCDTPRPYVCKMPAKAEAAAPTAPPATSPTVADCRQAEDAGQFRYRGGHSTTGDGRPCVRWDVALAQVEFSKAAAAFAGANDLKAARQLSAGDFAPIGETVGQAAAYCRDVDRELFSDGPFCFARTSAGGKLQAATCDVPQCRAPITGAANVAIAVILALCIAVAVAGLVVIGFRLWRRGRWAAGYRPQLNLDASTGLTQPAGTSFHNPIYMPANC